ncbi:Putative uncharacterized protein [Escherichia coli D6-117.29]|nr:Protein of unknown function [Escherichia coli D6-113.11]CDP70391.1 Protein of unknown function [Escherichia coli]CDP75244.1 Putative uncharacterized protein [Escherichia coli D6-117.29]CDU37245.1 Protein of unknown function [Escherichia coli D6-113.11]CDU37582.1 Protein of unknown function [Escherichia coli]
MSKVLEMLTT